MSFSDQNFLFLLIFDKIVDLPNKNSISHALHDREGEQEVQAVPAVRATTPVG